MKSDNSSKCHYIVLSLNNTINVPPKHLVIAIEVTAGLLPFTQYLQHRPCIHKYIPRYVVMCQCTHSPVPQLFFAPWWFVMSFCQATLTLQTSQHISLLPPNPILFIIHYISPPTCPLYLHLLVAPPTCTLYCSSVLVSLSLQIVYSNMRNHRRS